MALTTAIAAASPAVAQTQDTRRRTSDIIIVATTRETYAAPDSAAATRTETPLIEVPQSVQVPVILAYTGWSYWVFRGKVGAAGYH